VEHPSYISGRLRDIYKHTFYLQRQSKDADFMKIQENLSVILSGGAVVSFDTSASGGVVSNTVEAGLVESTLTVAGVDDLSHYAFDTSMDTLMIRFTSNGEATLQTHLVSNQEMIYDSQSAFAKFQTSCKDASTMFQRINSIMKMDPKPSTIRNPSSMAVAITYGGSKKYKKKRRKSTRTKTTKKSKKSSKKRKK